MYAETYDAIKAAAPNRPIITPISMPWSKQVTWPTLPINGLSSH